MAEGEVVASIVYTSICVRVRCSEPAIKITQIKKQQHTRDDVDKFPSPLGLGTISAAEKTLKGKLSLSIAGF